MKQHFHVCTKGLKESLLYYDESDFVCGMNDIPICLHRLPELFLLAFCLMNNHVHFVFYGTKEDISTFLMEFRRRTSRRLKKRYGDVHSVDLMDPEMYLLNTDQRIKEAIIYNICNPSEARICAPNVFEWSSYNLYFRGGIPPTNVQYLSEFSGRKLELMFHTRESLPGNVLVSMPKGYIHPYSFVAFNGVEQLFGNIKHFLYSVSVNNAPSFEALQAAEAEVSISDREVETFIQQLSNEKYGGRSLNNLLYDEKLQLGAELYKRHHVSPKQFARLSRVKLSTLELFMK